MIRSLTLAASLCAGIAMVQSAPASAEPPAALVDAARKEGTVTWYAQPGTRTLLASALEEWRKRYPDIHVEIVEASGPDTVERLRAERRAGKPVGDLVTFGDLTAWELAREGGFQPFSPENVPNAKNLNPRVAHLADGDRRYLPTVMYGYGIVVNTQALPEADWPKRWTDLTDPKYARKIAIHDMTRPGGGLIFAMLGLQPLGEDYFTALSKQNLRTFGRVQELDAAVVRGERPVALPGRTRIAKDFKGAPVKFIVPEDGLFLAAMMSGVVANTDSPAAGQLLLDFLLDPVVQRLQAEDDSIPVTTGVPSPVDLATVPLLGKGIGTPEDLDRVQPTLAFTRKLSGR